MDDKYLGQLSLDIGKEWCLLAYELGFSDSQLDHLRAAFPYNTPQCVASMLVKWYETALKHHINPFPLLIRSLTGVDRYDLVQKINCDFDESDNGSPFNNQKEKLSVFDAEVKKIHFGQTQGDMQMFLGPGVEAECMVRVYYNLSSPVPSYVDQVCDVACCGHYPNVYCCDQCDSTFRNADGHLSSGAVTGIVLGVLIGLVTLFVIFVYVYGRWRRDKDPVGRAMYRLYRMSTRRRRRPKPQAEQNGQTSTDGPSTITMSNGGIQNRGFSEGPGNYPRSRRRSPGTAETPMHKEQLAKPPRPGQRDPRNTGKAPVHSGEGPVKADPTSKYGHLNPPQVRSNQGQSSTDEPSAPLAMELDSRRLEKQSYNNHNNLPIGGNAQRHEPEKIQNIHQHKTHSDEIKPYSGQSDKPYQALGKRQDEHPYTVPQGPNSRDRYAIPRDNGEKQKINSESRLGPPSQPHQYSGGNKTSYSPDGRALHPPDRIASYQPDRQTSHHPNRDTSQPPNPSDRNTSYPSDRHTSHPPDRNTSYPSDRHTAHPSNKQTSHPVGKTNRDTSNRRDPPPSYPSTNEDRGGPGYAPYSSTPARGAPSRQPEYNDTPIRQGERDYRQKNDNRGVHLGNPGRSRQSQI